MSAQIAQRLWLNQSSLLQIPNFTEDIVQHCKATKKKQLPTGAAAPRTMTLAEYIAQDRSALKVCHLACSMLAGLCECWGERAPGVSAWRALHRMCIRRVFVI